MSPAHEPVSPRVEEIATEVVDAAATAYNALGPGLLESTYQEAMAIELRSRGIEVETEVPVPLIYKGEELGTTFRADMLVGGEVVLELKAVMGILPIHVAQVLTNLRLLGKRLGFVLNFNVVKLSEGIRRVIN